MNQRKINKQESDKRPKERSSVRIFLGKMAYTLKRYLYWYGSKVKFAHRKENILHYNEVIFRHRTPLLRKLRKVDMWLQQNKITNLRIAIERISGLVLYPGETFSYWKQIGKPRKKDGFVDGMVLFYGKFKPGIGGGLCQLSNLIYWMTLHTPLTVVERWRHSYDVFPDVDRTQPFGSGATCSYNYIDLQIKNETSQPMQLHLYLTETDLVGEWRSIAAIEGYYEVYEKGHQIQQEYWGGYTRHNQIYRRKYDSKGVLLNDEFISENHAVMMYEPLLEAKKNV
ncbi:MAG: vancomycin resistance protein [Anaerosolibacter sp.]|jgi:vancomycin resistance protein VanW|uniref:VanW family protein n=1 Tax=Anaerosolibacter sp. TaxID=1872527 RepID=UPI002623FBBC|nr:VanW family protein [Anaerosolibacter sp.]MDF2547473.1 vancomycin resistance protein [Anaerosolibacter sp.]